jgi:hypothetical protein
MCCGDTAIVKSLADYVDVFHVALDQSPGTLKMDLTQTPPGNAKITNCGSHSVQVVTLDSLWNQIGRRRIGFVKIDTEGWDVNVILGGRDAITTCRPNILAEFNRERMRNQGFAMDACWRFLVTDLHYVCYRQRGTCIEELHAPADYENLLFLTCS